MAREKQREAEKQCLHAASLRRVRGGSNGVVLREGCAGAARSILWLAAHEPVDPGAELTCEGRDPVLQMRRDDLGLQLALKGTVARQRKVEHTTECIDVCALVERARREVLWCHVMDGAVQGGSGTVDGLGTAEV